MARRSEKVCASPIRFGLAAARARIANRAGESNRTR